MEMPFIILFEGIDNDLMNVAHVWIAGHPKRQWFGCNN
jgi:hypothetical protein